VYHRIQPVYPQPLTITNFTAFIGKEGKYHHFCSLWLGDKYRIVLHFIVVVVVVVVVLIVLVVVVGALLSYIFRHCIFYRLFQIADTIYY
jgi:hypothetical protein